MNHSPSSQPVKSSTSQQALRAGQIPTMHDLLDREQVETLSEVLEHGLEDLESRFAQYVTNVSLKKLSRR